MKKHNRITTLILAALLQIANAQDPLCENGSGTDTTEAKNRAALSLAERVKSVTFGNSQMKETIENNEAKLKETTKTNTIAKPIDRHNITFTKTKTEDGWHSTACITLEHAYRPYLNNLEILVRDLKADEKSCKGISETYKSIYELERVLSNQVLANTKIQTEYQKLKKEYQQDTTIGIYLETKENIFGEKTEALNRKLREIITQNNCRIEQTKCKTYGGYTLITTATTEDKKVKPFDYCKAIVKVDLLNSKKQIFSPSIEEKNFPIGKGVSKPAACEKAIESSATEIFTKIRERISEACE
jgi:hypothetical protein